MINEMNFEKNSIIPIIICLKSFSRNEEKIVTYIEIDLERDKKTIIKKKFLSKKKIQINIDIRNNTNEAKLIKRIAVP
jgi:hypothetical protein